MQLPRPASQDTKKGGSQVGGMDRKWEAGARSRTPYSVRFERSLPKGAIRERSVERDAGRVRVGVRISEDRRIGGGVEG